jgi:hypothetical protein
VGSRFERLASRFLNNVMSLADYLAKESVRQRCQDKTVLNYCSSNIEVESVSVVRGGRVSVGTTHVCLFFGRYHFSDRCLCDL